MGHPLILEVTDPRGRVTARIPLPLTGCTIGRGYRNDVIVDDPYVDPIHLKVGPDPEGRLWFEDAQSTNGTWDARHHHRVRSGPVGAGLTLRVGRSTIRILSLDQPVPAALYDPGGHGQIGWLLAPSHVAVVLAGALALSSVAHYFGSTTDDSAAALVTPGLATLLLTALWAAGWAFTNRIVGQRFRFLTHVGWATVITTAYLTAGILFEWLWFLTPGFGWDGIEMAAWAGLGAWLLAGHFQILTEWPTRRRWVVAGGAVTAVILLVAILGRGNGADDPEFQRISPLKPMAATLIPATSADAFFRRAEGLRQDVDALAESEDPADPMAAPVQR